MSTAEAWDAALLAAPYPHLLQSYRWGELQSRFGWETHRETLETSAASVPVSLQVAPTLVPGQRYGYVPKGPAVGADEQAEVLGQLAEIAAAAGLAFLRVEPELEAFEPPEGWVRAVATQPPQTAIVDLTREPEQLMSSFKPKTRYNVRLAERRGVEVDLSDDITAFDALSRETSARHGIHLAEAPYLEQLHRLLAPDGSCRLYLARLAGEPVAGIVVVRFGGRATYLFGASSARGRDAMPAYLLHWRAMLEARASGDREYDLWGVPPDSDPGHPWAGLWQFKSGWNGRMVRYAGAFELPLKPAAMQAHRSLSRIRESVRRARSRVRGR
jgi:peptidoglycan pentaglycine glycine transferase (the first glycine)